MQNPAYNVSGRPSVLSVIAWSSAILLLGAIYSPEFATLWTTWRGDPALSHGPLIPLITAGLLWMRRERLRNWNSAAWPGLLCMIFACFVYLAAVWADIDFMKPTALILITLSAIGFVGGWKAFDACLGPICFLVFMIPWPTTLIDRLAFPMQLMSSAYGGLLAGILGVPIHREGVQLYVMPTLDAQPTYSIIVAEQCSGLTSMIVLLALGYLVAYHTPVRWYWRAFLVALCVPLTVAANAVRLAVMLFAGANHGSAVAKWIHDHESPVLIFLCSIGLMTLRHLLLQWQTSHGIPKGEDGESRSPALAE